MLLIISGSVDIRFMMSFSEIIMIMLVGLFLFKPEDARYFLKQLQALKQKTNAILGQFNSYLEMDLDGTPSKDKENLNQTDEVEKINGYLKQILQSGHEYEGEYSLEEVRRFYRSIERKKNKSHQIEKNDD